MLFKRRKNTPAAPVEEIEQSVLLGRIAEYTKPITDDWLFTSVEPAPPEKQRSTRSRRSRRRSTGRTHKPAPHPA
jgi:hypothetical protein